MLSPSDLPGVLEKLLSPSGEPVLALSSLSTSYTTSSLEQLLGWFFLVLPPTPLFLPLLIFSPDTSSVPLHQVSLALFPSFSFLPLDHYIDHVIPLINPPTNSAFTGCVPSTHQRPRASLVIGLPSGVLCPHLGMPNPLWTLRSPTTSFLLKQVFLTTLPPHPASLHPLKFFSSKLY